MKAMSKGRCEVRPGAAQPAGLQRGAAHGAVAEFRAGGGGGRRGAHPGRARDHTIIYISNIRSSYIIRKKKRILVELLNTNRICISYNMYNVDMF